MDLTSPPGFPTSPPKKLVVFTVATNIYLNYWMEMVQSATRDLDPRASIEFHVFTDQTELAESLAEQDGQIAVVAHKIENLGWPDATLLRYKLFSDVLPEISATHFMHLDADMVVLDPTALYDLLGYASERAVLVQHPGFARPRGMWRWTFYMRNPKVLATDLKSALVHGALGAWEIDRRSSAFVERSSRCTYVCGGVWLAPKSVFLDLVRTLASAVEMDFRRELVATWHDESHLNRWSTTNEFTLVGPEFCWAEQFPAIRRLSPKILAVDKGKLRTR